MKFICLSNNYKTKENNKAQNFYIKPETTITRNFQAFFYPEFTTQISIETYLTLKICRLGKHIPLQFANTYYDQIGIAINLTANDMLPKSLSDTKSDVALNFDGSTLMGNFIDKENFEDKNNIDFYTNINGQKIQNGNSSMFVNDFDATISHVSKYITLKIGDIILAGGIIPPQQIKIGDIIESFINSQKQLGCSIK